jgi:ribosomal protein S18 acetylase RimI-like enzyme
MRMLAVDPAHHGRGAGRALVMACIERARANRRRRLVLHTTAPMKAAIHIYESIGFRRELDLDFTPVPGVDLVGYAMELGED